MYRILTTTNLTNLTNNSANKKNIRVHSNDSCSKKIHSCSEQMIVYKEESYKIIGAAFEVYNTLGPGFLEAVYQEALEIELRKQGIPYEREKELKIQYDGVELKQTYKADFVCFGKIIVELKAVSSLDDAHRSQVYNYLHATNFKLGLLLNFGNSDELEKERLVL